MKRRGGLALASIDFLVCVALWLLLQQAPPPAPASIQTLGQYAVVITWPQKFLDDVDLWVRAPDGEFVYFARRDQRTLYLEHDDIPNTEAPGLNHERVVVRVAQPGEWVANVMLYSQWSTRPVPVTVELYRLAGNDRLLLTRHVLLGEQGEEVTAFRFVLDHNGRYAGSNQLPYRFRQ